MNKLIKIMFPVLDLNTQYCLVLNDQELFKNERNKSTIIKKICKHKDSIFSKYLILNYYSYLSKEDIDNLCSVLEPTNLINVFESSNKSIFNSDILLDRAIKYNLVHRYLNSAPFLDSNKIEKIVDSTSNIKILTKCAEFSSVDKHKITDKVLDIHKEKTESLPLYSLEDNDNDLLFFIKNTLLSSKDSSLIIKRLSSSKSSSILLEILNLKGNIFIEDKLMIIDSILNSNRKKAIINIDVNEYIKYPISYSVVRKVCNLSSTDELLNYISKLDKKFYSVIIEEIIKINDLEKIYEIAKNIRISDDDYKLLCDAIIKSNDLSKIYEFSMLDRSNPYIDLIGSKLAELNDAEYMYLFLKNAKGYSNEVKEILIDKIVKTANIKYICLVSIFIDNSLINKLFKNINELYNFIIVSGLFEEKIVNQINNYLFTTKSDKNITNKVKNKVEKLSDKTYKLESN